MLALGFRTITVERISDARAVPRDVLESGLTFGGACGCVYAKGSACNLGVIV